MQEDKDLIKNAPLLFSLEKKSPEIPQGYLEEFEEELLKQIDFEENKRKVIQIKPIYKWAAAAAVLFIMALLCNEFMSEEIPLQASADTEDTELTLTAEEMDEFLDLDDDVVMNAYIETVNMTSEPEIEYLIEDEVWNDELLIDL